MNRLLLVDTATHHCQVGIWSQNTLQAFRQGNGKTLEVLFPLLEQVLKATNTLPERLSGFIICEGPGSLLGLRLGKSLVDSWNAMAKLRPIYGYGTLDWPAQQLLRNGRQNFTLTIPIRRGFYGCRRAQNGILQPVEFLEESAILPLAEETYCIETRDESAILPGAIPFSYDLRQAIPEMQTLLRGKILQFQAVLRNPPIHFSAIDSH